MVLLITFASAFFTKPAHNQMIEVNTEAVFLRERFLNRCEKVFITFYGFTASTAHQVMVVFFFSMVIDRMVTQFTFINATCSLQKFEGTVYG